MVQQDPVVMADTFLANVTLGAMSPRRSGRRWKRYNWQTGARPERRAACLRIRRAGKYVRRQTLLALARVLVDAPQILILLMKRRSARFRH